MSALPPVYLSAAELGIPEWVREKLIAVIPKLERGEIEEFYLYSWGRCICGSAGIDVESLNPYTIRALAPLATPSNHKIRPKNQPDASIATRNFLLGVKDPWEFVSEGKETPFEILTRLLVRQSVLA